MDGIIIDDDATIVRSNSILSNNVDGAIVMMDIDTGAYYDLEASAAAIWELLDTPTTMGAICGALEALFAVDPSRCRTDVSSFLNDLAGKGLVKLS